MIKLSLYIIRAAKKQCRVSRSSMGLSRHDGQWANLTYLIIDKRGGIALAGVSPKRSPRQLIKETFVKP